MKVICWGTRGSLPVIGNKESKFYSCHTSCVELLSKEDSLIIDAGTALPDAIRPSFDAGKRKYSIFMSHFHWDHIWGFVGIYDLYFKGIEIDVYSPDQTVRQSLSSLFNPSYCPIDSRFILKCFNFIDVKQTAQLGAFSVKFVEVPHTGLTFALEVAHKNKRVIYMSDVNLAMMKESPFAPAADLLICDAFNLKRDQEERSDWGHSSAEQAAKFAEKIKAAKLALFHYDPNYTDKEIEMLYSEAKSAASSIDIHLTQDKDQFIL